MPALLERKMNQELLKQYRPVVAMTPEKKDRTKEVIEKILSRHYGKEIKLELK